MLPAETVEKVQMAMFKHFGIVKNQQLTGYRKPQNGLFRQARYPCGIFESPKGIDIIFKSNLCLLGLYLEKGFLFVILRSSPL